MPVPLRYNKPLLMRFRGHRESTCVSLEAGTLSSSEAGLLGGRIDETIHGGSEGGGSGGGGSGAVESGAPVVGARHTTPVFSNPTTVARGPPPTNGAVSRKRPRHSSRRDSDAGLSSSDEDGLEDEVPAVAPASEDFVFAQRLLCVRKPKVSLPPNGCDTQKFVLSGVCVTLSGRDVGADVVTLRVCDK